MRVGVVCASGVLLLSSPAHAQKGKLPAAAAVPLEALDVAPVSQDWGRARRAQSVDGHPLTIGGHVYEHGVGTHANSEWVIDLKGVAARFTASVGVDQETGDRGSIVFVVTVDGREAFRTATLRGGQPAQNVDIELRGAKELGLIVEDAGDGIDYDHADWADAVLTLVAGAKEHPVTALVPPDEEPKIAPVDNHTTAINSPRITGASPAKPFMFRIPATGTRPLRFTAGALPDGLTLDSETGIISGALKEKGRWDVQVRAEGAGGAAASALTIVGAPGAVALTPPMGWNSWNVWATSVDDAKVRAAAEQFERLGLAGRGYQFVNIDDAWEGTRDDQGRVRSNDRFPDMKGLAEYVHSKGLKLGIYSSPGPKTCAGYEGSYQHESSDAETYAGWGVDYLKYDWCSYGDIAPKPSPAEMRKPYEVMRVALDQSGRDIVFSFCQYGMGEVWRWGAQTGGNLWRTTGDITDTWSSMSAIGFGQAALHEFAGPGHWNDPDMLVVGQLGWGPSVRPTRLTRSEQVTHITLWSMLAAPLLIGCDLTRVDDFTLALLSNPEVIDIDQDPLGEQAHRVSAKGRMEIWSRRLADGTTAVALFNRSRQGETITVTFAELGLTPGRPVRDLWGRAWVPKPGDGQEFGAVVPAHGASLFRIGKPGAADR
jgi:alpha-galactosidase